MYLGILIFICFVLSKKKTCQNNIIKVIHRLQLIFKLKNQRRKLN